MSAEEFERLPGTDRKRELNDGVIVEVEIARAEHELVREELNSLLAIALAGTGFVVAPKAMVRLDADITRVPDLAIWRRVDLKKMDPDHSIVGGPLIAIEVVSSETAEDLDEKIQQYFAAGTKSVWAVYLKTRAVVAERLDGITRLRVRDFLKAPELLPGLKIHAAGVFALLDGKS
jgi:Uma2 family endonuclease